MATPRGPVRVRPGHGAERLTVPRHVCHLPAGSPDSIFEGVTASKGYVDFWNRVAPTGTPTGLNANRTQFHVTIAVTYYDFRNNDPAPGVPTDHWMVHCHSACADAGSWGDEVRVTDASFDIEQAPFARGPNGFFLGEYEGLSSAGDVFWPLFAIVNNGNTANRTNIVVRTAA